MDKSIEELLAEAGDNYMAWYEGFSNMKLKDSQ
jgi:hypothetical protein